MPSSIFPIVGDVVGNLVDTAENMNKDDDDDDDNDDDDDVAVVWCVSRVDDVTMNRDESDVDITDPDAVGKKIIHVSPVNMSHNEVINTTGQDITAIK